MAPLIDLFASSDHQQLPLYVTSDPEDTQAVACIAFDFYWDPVFTFYANHPWSLLAQVIDRICDHRSKVLLVTPDWPGANWRYPLDGITVRRQIWTQPLYFSTQNRIRPDGTPCFP